MDKEMMRALEADGEKLRALTGEDHGPEFFDTCPVCCGQGAIEKPNPMIDDPEFCDVIQCSECGGSGYVQIID